LGKNRGVDERDLHGAAIIGVQGGGVNDRPWQSSC
jgi:hypothetical protein